MRDVLMADLIEVMQDMLNVCTQMVVLLELESEHIFVTLTFSPTEGKKIIN